MADGPRAGRPERRSGRCHSVPEDVWPAGRGWLLARLALGARRRLDAGEGDADHLATKVVVARFYAEQLLPVVRAQLGAVTAGAGDLYAVPADGFSA
ncbi:MAG: hypothetical protein Ct9H300mP31_14280 [Acidimicrobiaceae bacterium]|nr:MAG: hypothetical protein Ct9H300mP31_14280 [Acidimicrobiaceae bacterium]